MRKKELNRNVKSNKLGKGAKSEKLLVLKACFIRMHGNFEELQMNQYNWIIFTEQLEELILQRVGSKGLNL